MEDETQLPLKPEDARRRFERLKAKVVFQKVLTSSDRGGQGRIVIPKAVAESKFPHLKSQAGMKITLTDVFGHIYSVQLRYWTNTNSRMYIMDGTSDLQQRFNMQVGDVLVFAKDEKSVFYVCGRSGTRFDVSRKPPTRNTNNNKQAQGSSVEQNSGGGNIGSPEAVAVGGCNQVTDLSGSGLKKRTKPQLFGTAKLARNIDIIKMSALAAMNMSMNSNLQGVADSALGVSNPDNNNGNTNTSMSDTQQVTLIQNIYSFWNGTALVVRTDGVFRAVPGNLKLDDVNKVMLHQQGCWKATVLVEGEPYQAYFDSDDAATAALLAVGNK